MSMLHQNNLLDALYLAHSITVAFSLSARKEHLALVFIDSKIPTTMPHANMKNAAEQVRNVEYHVYFEICRSLPL